MSSYIHKVISVQLRAGPAGNPMTNPVVGADCAGHVPFRLAADVEGGAGVDMAQGTGRNAERGWADRSGGSPMRAEDAHLNIESACKSANVTFQLA